MKCKVLQNCALNCLKNYVNRNCKNLKIGNINKSTRFLPSYQTGKNGIAAFKGSKFRWKPFITWLYRSWAKTNILGTELRKLMLIRSVQVLRSVSARFEKDANFLNRFDTKDKHWVMKQGISWWNETLWFHCHKKCHMQKDDKYKQSRSHYRALRHIKKDKFYVRLELHIMFYIWLICNIKSVCWGSVIICLTWENISSYKAISKALEKLFTIVLDLFISPF